MLTIFLRLIVATALSQFIWRAWLSWQNDPNATVALLAIGEVITVTVYLFARLPRDVVYRPIAIASTLCATFFFLFVALGGGRELAPPAITVSLQVIGIVWQIWSKLTLGRSFGLLPANRGVVTRGPYTIVRHPIYLGYFLNHLGFLLAGYSIYNLSLLSALYFFQILRIFEEERTLLADPAYRNYFATTRFRLIPGIF